MAMILKELIWQDFVEVLCEKQLWESEEGRVLPWR